MWRTGPVWGKERLLEFHPRDGWEPLCRFLDVPVLEREEFPKINEGDYVVALHKVIIRMRLLAVVLGWMKALAPVAVGGVAMWWLYRRQWAS